MADRPPDYHHDRRFKKDGNEKEELKANEFENPSKMGRRPSLRSLQERRRKSMTSEDLAMLHGIQEMLHNVANDLSRPSERKELSKESETAADIGLEIMQDSLLSTEGVPRARVHSNADKKTDGKVVVAAEINDSGAEKVHASYAVLHDQVRGTSSPSKIFVYGPDGRKAAPNEESFILARNDKRLQQPPLSVNMGLQVEIDAQSPQSLTQGKQSPEHRVKTSSENFASPTHILTSAAPAQVKILTIPSGEASMFRAPQLQAARPGADPVQNPCDSSETGIIHVSQNVRKCKKSEEAVTPCLPVNSGKETRKAPPSDSQGPNEGQRSSKPGAGNPLTSSIDSKAPVPHVGNSLKQPLANTKVIQAPSQSHGPDQASPNNRQPAKVQPQKQTHCKTYQPGHLKDKKQTFASKLNEGEFIAPMTDGPPALQKQRSAPILESADEKSGSNVSSKKLSQSRPFTQTKSSRGKGKGKAPAPRKSTSPVPLAKRFPSKSSGSEMNLTSIIQGVVFRELSEKEDVDVGYVIGQLEGAVYNTTQKHFGEDPSTELVLDEEVMGISDLFNSSAPENEGETMRSLFRTSDHWFQSIESALESPEADKRVSPKVPFPISDSFPRFELHQRNEVSSDGSFPRRIKGELKPWALGEEGSTMRELFGQFTGFQLECDPEGDANAFFSCTEGTLEEPGENVEGQLTNPSSPEGGKSSEATQQRHTTFRVLLDSSLRQAEKEQLSIFAAMEQEQRRRLLAFLAEEDRRILMMQLQAKERRMMANEDLIDKIDDFLLSRGPNLAGELEKEKLVTSKFTSRASGMTVHGGAVSTHHPKSTQVLPRRKVDMRQTQAPLQIISETSVLAPNIKAALKVSMKPEKGLEVKASTKVTEPTASSLQHTVIQGMKMTHHSRNPSSAA